MENENKWEYDYSASNNETGYPNVGSSGMNTANQYNEPEAQPVRPAYTAPADGGSVPPTPPEQPQYSAPQQPEKPRRKKKKFNGGKLVRSAVALVLAAAMGFAGGFVGAKYGGGSKVVIQQVERPASSDSSTDSTGNSISATSGTGLSTAQVAELVSPSVVVITTEQVVYSQWSWYGQSQVESGAGSGVIISSDGYILTCAHVVSGASNITVSIGDKDYPATLVGEDTTSDIAVVKVDATGLTPATVGNLDYLVKQIPAGSTWTVTGVGRGAWPMAAAGIVMGGNVRVGFEDNIYLERGHKAASNGELVAKVVRLAKELGREIATPDEARKYIGEGHFAPGSMLPKVQAAVEFAESAPGRSALITLLEKAKDGVAGKTGTAIHQ